MRGAACLLFGGVIAMIAVGAAAAIGIFLETVVEPLGWEGGKEGRLKLSKLDGESHHRTGCVACVRIHTMYYIEKKNQGAG